MVFSFPIETAAEGLVEVMVPTLEAFVERPSDYAPSKAPVFYNPVMELNRDLAVLVVQAFQRTVGRELRICEPLSGCGIRGIRLAKEVEGVEKVVMNDINRKAYQLAKLNVEKNALIGKITVENEDANLLLSHFGAPKKRFDYIDLDPFGSPMLHVDSALRALRSGSLLALTATDLAPLCGVHPKACIRKYGGKPLRTEYCHELALRLLAAALARSAARYDIGVKAVFSHSSEHYVRLYTMVAYGAKKANSSLNNVGYINHCFACFHRETTQGIFDCKKTECPECGSKMNFAGPLWIGKIVDANFVAIMKKEAETKDLRQKKRIRRLLTLAKEEADSSLSYYVVDNICDKFGFPVPPVDEVVKRLKHMRYRTSLTHFKANGFKSEAPAKIAKEAVIGYLEKAKKSTQRNFD